MKKSRLSQDHFSFSLKTNVQEEKEMFSHCGSECMLAVPSPAWYYRLALPSPGRPLIDPSVPGKAVTMGEPFNTQHDYRDHIWTNHIQIPC